MTEPWAKFYWSDYDADEGLRVCCLAAQGLWMRMLCLMARATPKGELRIGGEPCSVSDLSKMVGESHETVIALLDELRRRGVYSATRTGVIFCRRMRKDAEISRKRAEAGQLGGTVSTGNKRQSEICSSKTTANLQAKTVPRSQKLEAREKERNALARFPEFWSACPKKTAQGAAERAWLKATSLAEPDVLIAAMRRYAETQSGKDAAFTKTPGPWLNEKRWLDEGIAPVVRDDEAENEARAAWGGDAAKLVDEIGVGAFKAYFEAVQFDSGPPVRMRVSRPFIREQIVRKFSAPLRRIYGEVILEAAA